MWAETHNTALYARDPQTYPNCLPRFSMARRKQPCSEAERIAFRAEMRREEEAAREWSSDDEALVTTNDMLAPASMPVTTHAQVVKSIAAHAVQAPTPVPAAEPASAPAPGMTTAAHFEQARTLTPTPTPMGVPAPAPTPARTSAGAPTAAPTMATVTEAAADAAMEGAATDEALMAAIAATAAAAAADAATEKAAIAAATAAAAAETANKEAAMAAEAGMAAAGSIATARALASKAYALWLAARDEELADGANADILVASARPSVACLSPLRGIRRARPQSLLPPTAYGHFQRAKRPESSREDGLRIQRRRQIDTDPQ